MTDFGPDEGIDEGRFRRDQFDQFNVPVPGAFNRFSPVFESVSVPGFLASARAGGQAPYFAKRRFSRAEVFLRQMASRMASARE